MLGRSAEGPQAAPQGPQPPSPLSPQQTAEMSQKASDAFDAAAAGGLNNMAELKAVTSDIMTHHSRQDGTSRSPSPHMASVDHLSPAANLAMLQACVTYVTHTTKLSILLLLHVKQRSVIAEQSFAFQLPCHAISPTVTATVLIVVLSCIHRHPDKCSCFLTHHCHTDNLL